MTFRQYHIQRRKQLLSHINIFLGKKDAHTTDPLSHKALQRLGEFSTEGKMLRGIFTIFSYEMYGHHLDKNVLNVAAAMELSQAALLIHDDIMDNDRLRRGKKTIFAQYTEDGRQENIKDPDDYGKSMAIVVGDASFFMTYDLIGDLDVKRHVRSKIMNLYSREMMKVTLGQFMDYHFGKTSTERSHAEITEMYRLKTGSYTFTLPFVLGAYLADVSQKEIEILEKITLYLGTVFQIKDDEMGLFGDSAKTGKPVGSDVKEGKKTLFRAALYENVSDSEREKLDKIFGKQASKKDLEYIKGLLETYGISKSLAEKVHSYSRKAAEAVEVLSIEPAFKELFHELIEYNATRGT